MLPRKRYDIAFIPPFQCKNEPLFTYHRWASGDILLQVGRPQTPSTFFLPLDPAKHCLVYSLVWNTSSVKYSSSRIRDSVVDDRWCSRQPADTGANGAVSWSPCHWSGDGAVSSAGLITVDGTVAVTGAEAEASCLLERPLTPVLDRRRPTTLPGVQGGSATKFLNYHLYNK